VSTGWFRVEKHEGRWWFVDPDGRLFLSQGSLHMSANTPGGNSSWKWHRDKMPYTYQIKTG
jgi:hypothetical protein